jgi:hypothetical protein
MKISHLARLVGCLAGIFSGLELAAQTIFSPPLAAPGTAAVEATAAAQPPAGKSNIASGLGQGVPFFRRGPFGLRPHAEYRAFFAQGMEAVPGDARDTYIHTLAPGLLLELGKYCRLDYTPTWTFYSDPAFQDTADHAARFTARLPHPRGMLGVTQSYDSSYSLLIETGHQTHQILHSTTLDGTYKLGQRTSLEGSVGRSARDANAVNAAPEWTTSDWVQWSANTWLHYEFSPRFSTSVGVTAGYAEVSVGADMTFIQPQIRLAWKVGDKLTFTAQAGEERRQFAGDSRPPLHSPVYSITGGYQVRPTTKFSLGASRSVSASYFANQVAKGESWNAGFEQRLLQRFYLAVDLSERRTHYLSVPVEGVVVRADRYRAFNVRLTTVLLEYVSLGLVYQTARNLSDRTSYALHTHQYGFEVSVRF